MKRVFREAFDRELALLKERSRDFAADYPGIADRLGGLLEENLDPAVAGLLEGSAFLAARVQVKIDDEFRTFTHALLDQIFPDALAPTPSVMLARANPPYDASGLETGLTFEAGDYLDARYMDADKRVSCRFRLCAPLTLWPLKLTKAVYHSAPASLSALGQDVVESTKAGLEIELTRLNASGQTEDAGPISEVTIDSLPIYITAPMNLGAQLYEQMFCDTTRVSIRYLNKHGDPTFRRLPPDAIDQVGFDQNDWLFPHSGRIFQGFSVLREAFTFQRKFLGFRLNGLRNALHGIDLSTVQIVIEFDKANPILSARFEPEQLQLYTVPAVNLFEETSSQVRLDRKKHEYIVVPDSSPVTHYEIHDITDVYAHYKGHQAKVRIYPLYGLPPDGHEPSNVLYFTSARKPRRLTDKERRFGSARARYRGTETFVSLYEPPEAEPAQRLQVRALCSNRHLTEYLPIAQGENDFYLCEDQSVTLTCVAGPTPPRDALVDLDTRAGHRARAGDNYWRLLSYLSLSHHGIDGRGDIQSAAAALREMLSLFADLSDTVTEPQLQALRTVETRPVVRTVARTDGYHPARGIEVKVTFDEDAFDTTGIVLFGAVIDRFLAEYSAINSFTQCVIASEQRGTLKTWPPRTGNGPIL